jgi:hypothetical protein
MTAPSSQAGGRATEAGMAFQAAVGTWFAAHLVTDLPVGSRFGLLVNARPLRLQFETGDALDDIVLHLTDGNAVYLQCKTRPGLETRTDSALGKTIAQLVRFLIDARAAGGSPDPTRVAAVLAVADDAPRSLDSLEQGCRAFDGGEQWQSVIARVAADQRRALNVFGDHARAAWRRISGSEVDDRDLEELARLFRIRRFGEGESSNDWRQASHLVGSRLFNGEDAGAGPTVTLLKTVRQLVQSGAAADRRGLIRALRAAGHADTHAPGFDNDVAALREYSRQECVRLARHSRLPIGDGIPLNRECLPALHAAVGGGSLLVIGEPGAGKTGALVALAEQLLRRGGPFVFFSVERLVGLAKLSDFREELHLENDLLDILAAWPGLEPGVFIIDALDASRGGPSEAVVASLIELAVARLGERWSVVASIRTFDLLNGRRFREVMRGEPPDRNFAEVALNRVRHFRIPRLSEQELLNLAGAAPGLGDLVVTAPPKLKALLSNIFNLSLAAELIETGVSSDSIRTLTTQSELIDRYEDERLSTQPLKRAAAATIEAMVNARRLTVPQVSVQHDDLDQVLSSGVLVRAGDLVAFAHHVLFDHVAGRYYLSWSDPRRLQQQVSGDSAIGLLLGPALRFAMERIWKDDKRGRPDAWGLLYGITSATDLDPVVASVALRTIAERVETELDLGGLATLLQTAPPTLIGGMLSRLARFVSMSIADTGRVSTDTATAWAILAEQAALRGERALSDGARFLLWALFERADFTNLRFLSAFGLASRALLKFAWALEPEFPQLSGASIRFVVKSFGSEPVASRALLNRILEEPRFTAHAHEEAPLLAEGIRNIIPHDSEFAAIIFATLFGRSAPQEGTTWIGGHRSRILPLSSNRKQDYEHGRWYLVRALKPFLEADAKAGVSAVIGAVLGLAVGDAPKRRKRPETLTIVVGSRTLQILDDVLSLQDWREHKRAGDPEDDVLGAFVEFLRTANAAAYRTAIEVALDIETGAAVWARLLGIGAERLGMAEDLLWPLVVEPRFVSVRGLARDAIIYLAAVYPFRSLEDRAQFESAALSANLFSEETAVNWWQSLLARFLSLVDESLLATAEMRALRVEIQNAGRLRGNPAFLSIRTAFGPGDDITDRFLEHDGVDLEREPDRSVRLACRVLEDALKQGQLADAAEGLATLWRLTRTLAETADAAQSPEPHRETLHSSWGAVSNAIERIAQSAAYDPRAPDLPSLDSILALIVRLQASPYPALRDRDADGMMAWGNWDVRVYAASSLMALAGRFAQERPQILDLLEACLTDPTPTVRLQVAQSLNALWEIARERMWTLATHVAEHEEDHGVLGFFISGPLQQLAGADSDRCERLLSTVLDRQPESIVGAEKRERDNVEEAAGNLVAWLHVKAANQRAWTRFLTWTTNLVRGDPYLWTMLSSLRGVFVFGYEDGAEPESIAMRDRARGVLSAVVTSTAVAIGTAESFLRDKNGSDAERKLMEALYIAAERLLDQCCNQLYFASGAFRSSNEDEASGLVTVLAKQKFLIDYGSILDQIGRNGAARTVHHLIELYAHLADAAPDAIFDHIATILVGPAVKDSYHFEALGADALVGLVRRYLADYRAVFEDQQRRSRLVAVLELFSSVGWPDALKLLYELPDLLR